MTILLFVLLSSVIAFAIRNEMVCSFRSKLINRIADSNIEEINRGNTPNWNEWAEFRMISYESMLFKFWKPFKSFYKDTKLERLCKDI